MGVDAGDAGDSHDRAYQAENDEGCRWQQSRRERDGQRNHAGQEGGADHGYGRADTHPEEQDDERLADGHAALWALLGSSGGLMLAMVNGWPTDAALSSLYSYNASLAAIALSRVHRCPLAPGGGVLLALLLQFGFASLGLSVLTLPFILACWLIRVALQSWHRVLRDTPPTA